MLPDWDNLNIPLPQVDNIALATADIAAMNARAAGCPMAEVLRRAVWAYLYAVAAAEVTDGLYPMDVDVPGLLAAQAAGDE